MAQLVAYTYGVRVVAGSSPVIPTFLLEKITTSKKTLVSKTELIPLLLKKRPQLLLAVGAGDIGAEVEKIKEAFTVGH